MDSPKLFVLLLNYNGEEDTYHALECLEKQDFPHQTIVVENGSKKFNFARFKERFQDAIFLDTHHNLGYAGGNNVAIDYALHHKADWILLLNNDIEIEPTFLSSLLKEAISHPEGAIFGPKVVRYDARDTLDHFGAIWDTKSCNYIPHLYGKKADTFNKLTELDTISGCALLVRSDVFNTIGKLDPRFFLLWEESDFCARAKKAGFRLFASPKATLYHKVSASFNGKAHMQYYWWRNRLLWMRKNLSSKEYKKGIRKVVIKEMIKWHRHLFFKRCELFILQLMHSKKIEKKRSKYERLLHGSLGIRDYFSKRLGRASTY